MKTLVIDRFEGPYAICADADKKLFAIDKGEVPAGAGAGAVLCIADDGTLTCDAAATAERAKARKR